MPKRLLSILACGYILTFYSEHLFWAHERAADNLFSYVSTWLLYSFLAFAFLSLIEHFKVRSIWAFFLCGAVFGWLAEGVIVQTTYESLPLSISWTGLAWHAIITIWIGWYAVRKALQKGIGSTLKIATVMGIFYGLWALWWWNEPGDIIATPIDFATYTLITTLLLMLAYALYDRNIGVFKVGRRAKIAIMILLLLYFIVITVPAAPIAIIIMPLLLLTVYLVLQRNRRDNSLTSLLADTVPIPPLRNYLALLIMPIVAIIVYVGAYSLKLEWQTNQLVYLVTVPLGFMLFGVSLFKVWRGSRINNPA